MYSNVSSNTVTEIETAVTSPVVIFISVIYIVVMVTGTLVNPLIILTIAKTKTLRTAMNCHLVSLALSDMAVCIIVIPCRLVLYNAAHTSDSLPARCKLDVFLKTTCDCIHFAMLCGMSYERYKAVSRPFDKQNGTRRTMFTVIISWICALSVGALTSLKFGDSVTIYPCYREFSTYTRVPFIKFSEAFITLPLCIVCLCLISVFYCLMIQTLKEHNTKMKRRTTKVAPMAENQVQHYRDVKHGDKCSTASPTTTSTKGTILSTDTNQQMPDSYTKSAAVSPTSNYVTTKTTETDYQSHLEVSTSKYNKTVGDQAMQADEYSDKNEKEIRDPHRKNKTDDTDVAVKVHILTRQSLFRTKSISNLHAKATYKSVWRQLIEDSRFRSQPNIELHYNATNTTDENSKKFEHIKTAIQKETTCRPSIQNETKLPPPTINCEPIVSQYDTGQSDRFSTYIERTAALEASAKCITDGKVTHSELIQENNSTIKTNVSSNKQDNIVPLSSGNNCLVNRDSYTNDLCLNSSEEILQHQFQDEILLPLQSSNYNDGELGIITERQSIPLGITDSDLCRNKILKIYRASNDIVNENIVFSGDRQDSDIVSSSKAHVNTDENHKQIINEIEGNITNSEETTAAKTFESTTETTRFPVTTTTMNLLNAPSHSCDSDRLVQTNRIDSRVTDTISKVDVVEMDGTVHKNVAVEGAVVGAVCVMNTSNRLQGRRKVEMRAAKRIAILISSFVVLWLPLPVTALFLSSEKQTSPSDLESLLVAGSISALTGAFNPLFNLLLNKQLRSASIRMIKNGIKVCKRC